MGIDEVQLTKRAGQNLQKLPRPLVDKFFKWVKAVRRSGIREVRKIKSYHDEPLQGKRFGQRSIRLNRSYRAFYVEEKENVAQRICVLEVNKHDY